MKKMNNINCQDFDKVLVDYCDGTLTPQQNEDIESHLAQCVHCGDLYKEYIAAVGILHNLPQLNCPAHLVDSVINSINPGETKKSSFSKLYSLFPKKTSWQFAYTLSAAAIIIALLFINPDKTTILPEKPHYTAEEVEKARKDIELALGFFHYVSDKTKMVIRDEVISKGIGIPVNMGIKETFKNL